MNIEQLRIAIRNTNDPGARRDLEQLAGAFEAVCELNRTFGDRVNASKVARGEGPTKLRKAKREEVAEYEKDYLESEQSLTQSFSKMEGRAVVRVLASMLEQDVAFWSKNTKGVHPGDRHIVDESLTAKSALQASLRQFLEKYPSKHDS
jgi:hypothetical protein